MPYGNRGRLDGNGNAATSRHNGGGLFFGFDSMRDGWQFGLMGGYGESRYSSPDRGSEGEADTYSFGVYGARTIGPLSFSGGLTYGYHDISTAREAVLGGITQTLTADYGSHAVAGFAETSLPMSAGEFLTVAPFAAISHVVSFTDGYGENGGNLALTSKGQTEQSTFSRVGLRAERFFALEGLEFSLHASAAWQHRLSGEATATHGFDGGPDAFAGQRG